MSRQDNAPFLLTVLTGPNAGATAPLGRGRSTVGGDDSDGVILEGVAPGLLGVTLEDNRARLVAQETGARCGGQAGRDSALAPGAARIVTLPAMVRLNDETLVNIARCVPANGGRLAPRTAALMVGLALTGGLLIGLQLPPDIREAADLSARAAVVPDAPNPASAASAPGDAATAARPGRPALVATSPKIDACTAECQAEAAAALGARLAAAGLTGLKVDMTGGVMRVTGTMPPGQHAAWTEQRRRFESDYGRSLPLVVAIGDSAAEPALAVASIWLGQRPEVTTKSGQTLRIGDVTPDGWTVDDIARGRITLTRGGDRTVVEF